MANRPSPAPDLTHFQPMLAERRLALPRSGTWHYEIKFDGYRMLAATGTPALRLRQGSDATTWFPELAADLARLPAGAVLDGEVCVLDDIGRPDFDRLHARALRRRWYPGADLVVLCAFDLLAYCGRDLRALPIEQRKAQLQQLLAGTTTGLLYVSAVEDGTWLYHQVLQLKLEGVVAKRAGSAYTAGRSSDWLKIKRPGAVPPVRFRRGG
ncbi:Multifunctional non-homologous end joining protein LigD [compost metagenome]